MKKFFLTTLLAGCLGAASAMADLLVTDNQDGTISDPRTNLVWAKDANCFGALSWSQANATITALNKKEKSCASLTAHRQDWRLPSRAELATLLDKTRHESGLSLPANHPFNNVQRAHYWTRDQEANKGNMAWYVNLHNGHEDLTRLEEAYYLWPVAGQPR